MRVLDWFVNTDRHRQPHAGQFGVLLGLMFIWLAGLAVVEAYGMTGRVMGAAFVLIALQALLITARDSRERGVFLAIGLFLLLEALFDLPDVLAPVAATTAALVLLFVPIRLSVYVLNQDEVDGHTVLGALCAYIFLGLSFAVVYNVIASMNPAAIFTPEEGEPTFVTWVYFSFTTLSTLGYGDIAPRTYPARMTAILEALIGQLYLVVVVARLVGLRMATSSDES